MARKRLIIAIDGPAGVGKSTVGRLVARRLGYRFLNTGEMYRALTWKALCAGIKMTDGRALARLAQRVRWDFRVANGGTTLRTCVDGEPVASQIREERVSRNSSLVAGFKGVRRHLRMLQRRIGREGGIVMEGRDITTNVFPNADYKIYLDAAPRERARRRYHQLLQTGRNPSLRKVLEAVAARDAQDAQRKINPLRKAQDALFIDSTELTLHQVAARILRSIRR